MSSPRVLAVLSLALLVAPLRAEPLPLVKGVELQPLGAQAQRLVDALDLLGSPVPEADKEALQAAARNKDHDAGSAAIQTILDRRCLAGVRITGQDREPKVEARQGPAKPELAEQGWRVFLVKVDNPGGLKDVELRAASPNAMPLYRRASNEAEPARVISLDEAKKRFLDLQMFNDQPLVHDLGGLEVEYRIVQIYCREAGSRTATLGFNLHNRAGKDRPLAQSNQATLAFVSAPAVPVKLRVHDDDGKPVMGAFTFRDRYNHVYPAQSRRLAPDFFFHPQIYRADGETVALQPGKYRVTYTRGPEYLVLSKEITVPVAASHVEEFQLKRWAHPAAKGWYSGDHHIHAAGCAHYDNPTEGVTPEDMMRHVLGEDLNVGCCLSWGPCWYHQKSFFEGKTNRLSTADHLLRYDVEVSGFPSSHAGHICLLRLRDQDYPGTKLINDWPSWDLPIFEWAKAQGAVVGFAHSGHGLDVGPTRELPNYIVPPMNGIGANEYIVDVTHGMCDFISTVDTQAVWELNIWYHTLNCGYRCRISGETDFPCIYGERVGIGRSYVHLDGKLNFEDWAEGIKQGRSYVSDGKSHLLDFTVNDLGVGEKNSEVKLSQAGTIQVKANVAALLEPEPTPETERIRAARLTDKPYWDLERARSARSRKVPVELVVNGRAVEQKEVVADGKEHAVTFATPIKQSSWVCLRIFPSSHTNPVFVVVDDKPIRVSKKSAEWCLKCVEKCWQEKKPRIRKTEQAKAEAAYDYARTAYRKILEACGEE